MKRVLIIILTFVFFSCNSDKSNDISGKWEDCIQLSTHEISIPASGGIDKVNTMYPGWVFKFAKVNGEIIKPTGNTIVGDWFMVEKVGREIRIQIEKNSSDSERSVVIGLRSGDFSDALSINQEK